MWGREKSREARQLEALILYYKDELERKDEEIQRKDQRITQLEDRLMAALNPTAHQRIHLGERAREGAQTPPVTRSVPIASRRPPELSTKMPKGKTQTPRPPA